MTSLQEVLFKCEESCISNPEKNVSITKIVGVDGATDAGRDGIYRINHPVSFPGMDFSFNQYLLVDRDASLLWETGFRSMFPHTVEAIRRVLDPAQLKYLAFSHHEADEDGAANDFLALCPDLQVLTSPANQMINASCYDAPVRALQDGEEVALGRMKFRMLITPHFPHNWDSCLAFEPTTRSLLASDLVTQVGAKNPPVQVAPKTVAELPGKIFEELDPSSWSWTRNHNEYFERVKALQPKYIMSMHGSAFKGENCADLLESLRELLEKKLA